MLIPLFNNINNLKVVDTEPLENNNDDIDEDCDESIFMDKFKFIDD